MNSSMDAPTATFVSMPAEPSLEEEELLHDEQATPSSASHLRKYRGGFTSSICDIFRDPHRRTDCCAVACCGVLSSDRTRYLLTGQRPPPLWLRVLAYLIIPVLFIAAMSHFAVDVAIDEGDEEQTQKVPPPGIFWAFILYIIIVFAYGYVKNRSTRKEIMTKLFEERSRDRGEEVDPLQLQLFLSRHNLDTTRAHCCWSFCYTHDHDFFDQSGVVNRDGVEEDAVPEEDLCTRLWGCLSNTFWCCGCWCQCCGCCALAQEEREVNRLTGNEEHKIDYLTFQPYSEYYPSVQQLQENRSKNPLKHIRAISDLSSKLLKNVAAVLLALILFALSDIDANFTWENMLVLLLTLGQAFFIEYLVHWRWNLFDLSFDSVIKYFACGFLLTTPMAVIFEMMVSTLASIVIFIVATVVIVSDSELEHDLATDHEKGMKELAVDHPVLFVFMNFLNAFLVAALVEETVKYYGYRMVVTPDLLPQGRLAQSPTSDGDEELEPLDRGTEKNAKSTGAGITVAMVSTALGFACCENLIYIFVYSPPSLGVEVSTLLARSFFPVHPLCAAIQSIGVCKRDLEGDRRYGLGRIVFPAILLHGSFDFILMVAAYFQQREDIIEENDGDGNAAPSPDDDANIVNQLPALISGLLIVITGYIYYVVQSRAQALRLIAMDNATRDEISAPLV
ncbi:hypothetical protein ACHAXR_004943 [Thalassiosira sp. AJA248-18]